MLSTPALLFENQTIVVSPLVALMDDQVIGLKDLGVKAECSLWNA